MIAAMVPELQLESFAAECKAGELMSETDAKDGLTPHEAADVVHRISARLGIARAVREKNAIRLQGKNIFGWRLRRDHCDFASLTA